MKARGSWFLAAALAILACGGTVGCDLGLGSSKVAHGQRYRSEDSRFDPYFDSIHEQQVAAAAWPDEKKAARRPLVNTLALTPDATDAAIVSASHARVRKLGGGGGKLDVASAHVTPAGGAGDGALFAAVEEGVRLELERARKLRATSDKLEDMARHGEELKKTADREYENRGAERADEKKSEKRNEIRSELGGAVRVLRGLARDAGRNAREAQDFIEDLGEAIEAKDAPARRRGERESKPLPPPPKPAKPEAKRPVGKPAEKPVPDEVFNP